MSKMDEAVIIFFKLFDDIEKIQTAEIL